ncbi:Ldh family oxidoreductase [Puniceibacterium sp. IMCC21224]|uniref:Ldh family oxidoreductase n=1 Tax=Puniceibacterium sp. IMCC21224 TaxID=1618204 RepID=UPI00064DABDF|nr:Ldh family oxidoreductase [Puniceibacterium sp. IMCC21224]KMK68475.1 malate/lactate dehydrogenase [Puniceibacterium sp. IMCC21224]
MHIDEATALRLATQVFVRAGVAGRAASDTAEILTLAEMMGIGTHGLKRVPFYADRIAAGGIDPAAVIQARAPALAMRHVDGQNGLGPAVARYALDQAMDAARQAGIGIAFCRGSNHLGALAPYLWIAAEAGFACLMTSNTSPMIAPAGGRAPQIGNNPLGIGLPNPGGTSVLLDMALSVVARSRVRAAAEAGREIPDDWATDAQGYPTRDPLVAAQGLMRAIGGDKGANLALCLDLLAGGLSGASMLSAIPNSITAPDVVQNIGHMILLIDTARLLPADALSDRMAGAAQVITQTAPIDPVTPPRMPGARAIRALTVARRDGLLLPPALLADLRKLAGE